jgi:hypothetical protein
VGDYYSTNAHVMHGLNAASQKRHDTFAVVARSPRRIGVKSVGLGQKATR